MDVCIVVITSKRAFAERLEWRRHAEGGGGETEMEKRADAADASVLFFSLAVLICWLYMRKLAKKRAVLYAL